MACRVLSSSASTASDADCSLCSCCSALEHWLLLSALHKTSACNQDQRISATLGGMAALLLVGLLLDCSAMQMRFISS